VMFVVWCCGLLCGVVFFVWCLLLCVVEMEKVSANASDRVD
jgi:hypothetical protein